MGMIITDYGVAQIAAKQAASQTLNITDFVLANVAGLDFTQTPPGTEVLPAAGDIVYQGAYTKAGYITEAKVTYSLFLGSDVGDFDFNWQGLIDDVGGLIAVAWVPLQIKRKYDGGQIGNNLSRNFVLGFDGAAVTTAINVDANAWQFDFAGDFISLQAKADANETGLAAHLADPNAHGDYLTKDEADALYLNDHGQCVLKKSGADLLLSPFNGNKLLIDSGIQSVPDAGVSLAATGLAVDTDLYLYAYMDGASMTLEASETGHETQAGTGIEIKTGDSTRTLVGLARAIAGPAWQDSRAQRFVRSWFNSPAIEMVNGFDSDKTTTSLTTFVELSATDRIEFLSFEHEVVALHTSGRMHNSNPGGAGALISIGIDGTTPQDTNSSGLWGGAPIAVPAVCNVTKSGMAEGYHYATIIARHTPGSGTGTLTFWGDADPAAEQRMAINGIINGG